MILPVILIAAAAAGVADVRLPQYTRQVLPNGAVLIVMPRAEVPLQRDHLGGDQVPRDRRAWSPLAAASGSGRGALVAARSGGRLSVGHRAGEL